MKREQHGSIVGFYRLIKALLPSLNRGLIVFIFGALLYETLKLVPSYLMKLLIDELASSPSTQSYGLIGSMFVVLTLLVLLEVAFIAYRGNLAANQQSSLFRRLFSKLASLPTRWHERHNSGTLISKVSKASKYAHELIWMTTENIIPIIIQLVLTAIIMLWIDWRIGLVFIVFTPFLLLLIDKQFQSIQKYREAYHTSYDTAIAELSQTLINIQTVKDYVQEDAEGSTHSKHVSDYAHHHAQRMKAEERRMIPRDVLTNFVRVCTLGLAVYLFLNNQLTLGDIVFVFTLTEKAYINLFRMGRVYSFMGDTHESLERAHQILSEDGENLKQGSSKFTRGDIVFDNVTFSYARETVLKNITLTIPKNKTTALVGPSGAGKTTIVRLITRQYEATQGEIRIGNTPIRNLSLKTLRENCTFVSQHTEMFDRTVAQNIAYANRKASRRKIIAAAKKANAHDFIMSFPDGYDTIIGERGVRLSGGQRQRVSIARALLADSPIIIFDEATSSLDSESERSIQKALLEIKNRTVIIIAHRFSTIEHADQIVVLSNGKVDQVGTHKELLSHRSGLYKRMRKLQQLGELRD